jgi:hypothetical protein
MGGPIRDPALDRALRHRELVDYRADSALTAQIDAGCAAVGLARCGPRRLLGPARALPFVRRHVGRLGSRAPMTASST